MGFPMGFHAFFANDFWGDEIMGYPWIVGVQWDNRAAASG